MVGFQENMLRAQLDCSFFFFLPSAQQPAPLERQLLIRMDRSIFALALFSVSIEWLL